MTNKEKCELDIHILTVQTIHKIRFNLVIPMMMKHKEAKVESKKATLIMKFMNEKHFKFDGHNRWYLWSTRDKTVVLKQETNGKNHWKKRRCPAYDNTLPLVVRLQFWSSGESTVTILFPLLPGPLWFGIVVCVMIQCIGQINLFENYWCWIGTIQTI